MFEGRTEVLYQIYYSDEAHTVDDWRAVFWLEKIQLGLLPKHAWCYTVQWICGPAVSGETSIYSCLQVCRHPRKRDPEGTRHAWMLCLICCSFKNLWWGHASKRNQLTEHALHMRWDLHVVSKIIHAWVFSCKHKSQIKATPSVAVSMQASYIVATMIIMVDQNKSRVCINRFGCCPSHPQKKQLQLHYSLTETVTGTNHSHLQIPAGSASN